VSGFWQFGHNRFINVFLQGFRRLIL